MTELLGGIDIGGTKCAVSVAARNGNTIEILDRTAVPTPPTPQETMAFLLEQLARTIARHGSGAGHSAAVANRPALSAIGISCGGPLDADRGVILSPPNLPGWDAIDAVTPFRERFRVPARLQNDANACALAEWNWGAGVGTKHMIFLTFGTGMGAGLILNGRLFAGANGMAGEVGHMRLAERGPVGFGKEGSFEGFCSGGGIARLAAAKALEAIQRGEPPSFCPDMAGLAHITALEVAEAARRNDPLALELFRIIGHYLGRGLATLVDLFNPELIVIGSIYLRQRGLLERHVMETLAREALPRSMEACRIVPAGLGERVGDYAAFAVAIEALREASE